MVVYIGLPKEKELTKALGESGYALVAWAVMYVEVLRRSEL
jgi:hypothetical protein